ncbi:MAG: nucleoside triphosphate pyrophosphohydrolase [Bacteroidetes bacterium GWC2_33_15]|nr:MAG: nucleoside triphosphate pyrophosphohydrolase [Bacteroidetes bacterium GWA2_33_15]OFX51120.1 MAG: nucleoside triphosphate pyrophosphohydrolase [Bacteroidetes bacterium GWC2_33_15]OFX66447.1 MAG: nucleoside triphosphate pyrophosphohydrolase [Bacteroidetes bacterium GWB2_32_14]OFX70328.1 MAG: nucleoside triphosphate pyrophosphohydrolase [Bacteroidetes bacterium GWD2_33_33]HAN17330.1 nucleoside triphosphate pyrophosphohydrolase [Bacteroidales bacterium]
MKKELEAFNRLLEIMDELREKCPWDQKQTIESLRTLTIEETYELAEAIIKNDMKDVKKELGDILLHIVFYSKIASETKLFDITDVINGINEKLVHRHPHVFGDVKVKNHREVEENWEEIKMNEKDSKKSVLSGVPDSLPALIKATRIQQKVRGVGFDWDKRSQIWDKVREELTELQHEVECNDQEKIEAEFGDLFFSIINAARLYDIDPETALERTNKKFIKRFKYLEEQTINKGLSLKNMTLEEMNHYWEHAKKYDK